MMISGRTCLRIYCLSLGLTSSFSAFLWTIFQVYLLYTTAADDNDLMVARYLDISFGLLALSSSFALIYGAFVESKTWLTVWTLGSTTLIIGRWAWFFYQKYWIEHPESLKEAQEAGVILSAIYILLIIPVLVNYKYLESNHIAFSEWVQDISQNKMCRNILGPCNILFSTECYNDIRQSVYRNSDNNVVDTNRETDRETFADNGCNSCNDSPLAYWNGCVGGNCKSVKHGKPRPYIGHSYSTRDSSGGHAGGRPIGN